MPNDQFAPDLVVEPQSVDDAREAIEHTRGRISATLDAIESRIDETKQELRRRVDVLRPVRERISASPWSALAIGAGAGLALGLLTAPAHAADADRRARRSRRRARGGRRAQHVHGSTREHDTAYGRSRVRVHGGGGHGGGREPEPASMQERIVDHLLDALTRAVSDGVSLRIRKQLLD